MNELNIVKQTLKMVAFTVGAIALSRVTQGYFIPVFALMGVWCAFSSKIGWALVFYVLMPFFVILNPGLSAVGNAVAGASLRLGPLLIGLLLAMLSGSRRGHHRLPLGSLTLFLFCAAISSIDGWAPSVSYMKMINFIVFLIGIWFGTQNLQHRPKDVFILRSFFLAMAVILIWGSIALIPFPSIAYATSLRYAMQEGGVAYAEDLFRTMQAEGVRTLFCGATNHSQALAPLLCCSFVWVLCDMLFVERAFRKFHVALLVCALPLFYMTRSRVALVTLCFILMIVFFYTTRKIQLRTEVRQKLGKGMFVSLIGILLLAAGAQIKSGAMSSWLRKTDRNSVDNRSLQEALTESRMGLMEMSLWEYERNPLLGSGFQVAYYTRDRQKEAKGLVFSSPIEKGILPMMVLGETGILGAAAFLIFLLSFWRICARRQYYVTITTFSVFLMTNMGEATFFSPGGAGGIMWMICVVGGFTLDTVILYRKNLEQQWGAMAAAAAARQQQEMDRRRRLGQL